MSWRDNLLPASFRGVPFQYLDTRRDGGRRLAVFDYPGRDDNYVEDLGAKTKTFTLQAFILGADYFSDRDALEDALDAEGSATLVHPYKGNLTVACDRFSVQESIGEGRIARFEITFVLAGAQPSPTSSTDTAAAASDSADNTQDTLGGAFDDSYSEDGLAAFMVDELVAMVAAFIAAAEALVGHPGIGNAALAQSSAAAPAPVGQAVTGNADLAKALAAVSAATTTAALGSAVTAFFSAYAAAAAAVLPATDETLTSRGVQPPTDPSFGLAAFAAWGADLPPVIGSTPQRLLQAQDQAAFVTLVQGSATAALAQLYANTDFVSSDDAQAARDQISDMIDRLSTAAADIGDDASFEAWMALATASATDLTARAQQLPNILHLQFAASLPSLALAQRLYQDGTRAPELVSRNAAPHPLFMPRTLEALAS